jgi:hypothetical protein
MSEFLVELYIPRTATAAVRDAIVRARRAAVDLTADGTSVRFLHFIVVPEDETCLFLFEAASADAVLETAHRAGLSFDHIAETSSDASWSNTTRPTRGTTDDDCKRTDA